MRLYASRSGRRRVTSFAFPSEGAPTGASLHLRLPQSNDGGPAPSTQTASTAPTAARASRLAPPPPICAETCNWASDADCDDGGPGSGSARPGPTACGTGSSSIVSCGNKSDSCVYMTESLLRTAVPKVRATETRNDKWGSPGEAGVSTLNISGQ